MIEHYRPVRKLRFAPLAWLKWQFLCHAGPTEVAGFGLSAIHDPFYVEDILVIEQRATAVTVAFDDKAIADLFDRMTDLEIAPHRFARVWLHSHPGASPAPSSVDEATFSRVFGPCDWSVMGILSRTSATYARLQFNAGPGGSLEKSMLSPSRPGNSSPNWNCIRLQNDSVNPMSRSGPPAGRSLCSAVWIAWTPENSFGKEYNPGRNSSWMDGWQLK
jgi:hypothetical protein